MKDAAKSLFKGTRAYEALRKMYWALRDPLQGTPATVPNVNAQQFLATTFEIGGVGQSRGQFKQDIMALLLSGFKQGGYFVEFGATDGKDFSNTYMLEKSYGWTGIVAEPGRLWHKDLCANRTCHVDLNCVWTETGNVLPFNASEDAHLATLSQFSDVDLHRDKRARGETYDVDTISLGDLLAKYNAPPVIDYMSVDTEGSEYDILKAFDFSAYTFRFITVEHNFTANRERILQVMTAAGYQRLLPEASQYDDWYVPRQR